MEQVDQPGVRIIAKERSAYELWLSHAGNLKHAQVVTTATIDESFERFKKLIESGSKQADQKLVVLAGLRPKLAEQQELLHKELGDEGQTSTILEGNFTSVKQAIGCKKGDEYREAAAWLHAFVEEAKGSGFVAELIQKHGVEGRLSVAEMEKSGEGAPSGL